MNRKDVAGALRRAGLWHEAQYVEGGGDVSHAVNAVRRSLSALADISSLALWSGLSEMAEPTAELYRRLHAAEHAVDEFRP